MRGGILFSPASSPIRAYKVICDIKQNQKVENVFVLPLGTKPCSVGAVLYVVNNKDHASLIFDWPMRKAGRTKGIGEKYLYRCMHAVSSNPT